MMQSETVPLPRDSRAGDTGNVSTAAELAHASSATCSNNVSASTAASPASIPASPKLFFIGDDTSHGQETQRSRGPKENHSKRQLQQTSNKQQCSSSSKDNESHLNRFIGDITQQHVLAYLFTGLLAFLFVLCISLGANERPAASKEIVHGAGNALESVAYPGEDNVVARTILALPEYLREPLKEVAVVFGTIRERPTLAKVKGKLPYPMQRALEWRADSQDLRKHAGGDPVSDRCSDSGSADIHFEGVRAEYLARHQAGGCLQPQGMWLSKRVAPVIRYKYEMVAQLLSLGRGQRVLDWGAGCGHAIDLIAGRLGFEAFALDLIEANALWGKNHLTHISSFCAMDGSTLHFPDNSLDAVLSNGALVHADGRDAQCRILRDQVLRVLRTGGCAWLGFNGFVDTNDCGEAPPANYWAKDGPCFRGRDDVVIATAMEREFFGFSEYDRRDTYSIFMCKKPPAPTSAWPKIVKAGSIAAATAPQRSNAEEQKHIFAQSVALSLQHEESKAADSSVNSATLEASKIRSHLLRTEDIVPKA